MSTSKTTSKLAQSVRKAQTNNTESKAPAAKKTTSAAKTEDTETVKVFTSRRVWPD